MNIRGTSSKSLIAIDNHNKIVNVLSKVLRKPVKTADKQSSLLSKNSICIVCNYKFNETKLEWSNKVKAICHPFRDDSIFPKNIKKYLLSESDFCDTFTTKTNIKGRDYNNFRISGKYDFAIFTLIEKQGIRCKGLYMLPLIDEAAEKAGVRGIVINYVLGRGCGWFYKRKKPFVNAKTIEENAFNWLRSNWNFKNLKVINRWYDQRGVCSIMQDRKFILFPNNRDASPRMITESIVRNIPVLVNSDIYGGWKYVTENTGLFFDGIPLDLIFKKEYQSVKKDIINNIAEKMNRMMKFDRSNIHKDYFSKYGFIKSSKRLAKIINDISGSNYKFVFYKDRPEYIGKVKKRYLK